jgi:integration host factor subunit alpha
MAEKVTKADFIETLYEETNINRKDIHILIDKFLEQVKGALIADRTVELRGFGTFEVRTRKGRAKARNPRTGETVSVGDHGVAVFRPGKELKQLVWTARETTSETK